MGSCLEVRVRPEHSLQRLVDEFEPVMANVLKEERSNNDLICISRQKEIIDDAGKESPVRYSVDL